MWDGDVRKGTSSGTSNRAMKWEIIGFLILEFE